MADRNDALPLELVYPTSPLPPSPPMRRLLGYTPVPVMGEDGWIVLFPDVHQCSALMGEEGLVHLSQNHTPYSFKSCFFIQHYNNTSAIEK